MIWMVNRMRRSRRVKANDSIVVVVLKREGPFFNIYDNAYGAPLQLYKCYVNIQMKL